MGALFFVIGSRSELHFAEKLNHHSEY